MHVAIGIGIGICAGFIGGVVAARRAVSEIRALEADLKALIAKLEAKL